MSDFGTMTIQFTINNTSKHNLLYDNGEDTPVPVPAGKVVTIPITFKDMTQFSLTESNNPDAPLHVILSQTSDNSADVIAAGTGWDTTIINGLWICEILSGSTPVDRIVLPIATSGEGAIVIVGTVEIFPLTERLATSMKN